MPKKIIFLISSLRLGGQERQLYAIMQNKKKLDILPTIVLWNHEHKSLNYLDRIRELNIEVIYFNKYQNRVLKLFSFITLINKKKPDIVFSYSLYTNFIVQIATQFSNALPIGSIRSSFQHAKENHGNVIASICFRYPRIQISNNYSVTKELSNCFFWKPKKTYVINNIIDTKAFYYHPFPHNKICRVIAIGSLFKKKGFDNLLEVAKNLVQENIVFVLDIFGDGPEFENLQHLINKYDLNNFCTINKSRFDIQNQIIKSNILIHLSHDEGSPNVVIEAMSIGRAVIASNVGDVPRMIENAKNGFLVKNGDIDAATMYLKKLIDNYDLSEEMGIYGNQIAVKNYSIDQFNISFKKVISERI